MARVKTFRIHPEYGVPDKDVKDFLEICEAEMGFISVATAYIPSTSVGIDPRLTVIITKLDDASPVLS